MKAMPIHGRWIMLLVITLGLIGCTVPAIRPAQLRLENDSAVALDRVVVIFPHERIIFGPLPPGTTSAFQPVPRGVYGYAAYEVRVNGQTIAQPVEDWVGEQPLAGTHFTYVLTVDLEQPQWQQIRADVRSE